MVGGGGGIRTREPPFGGQWISSPPRSAAPAPLHVVCVSFKKQLWVNWRFPEFRLLGSKPVVPVKSFWVWWEGLLVQGYRSHLLVSSTGRGLW